MGDVGHLESNGVGAGVNDATPTVLAHRRQELFDHEKHRLDIHPERLLPRLKGEVVERYPGIDASVVDQNVCRPEGCVDRNL